MSAGGGKRYLRKVEIDDDGQLLAGFSDGNWHVLKPVAHRRLIDFGCVQMSREALKRILETVEEQDRKGEVKG